MDFSLFITIPGVDPLQGGSEKVIERWRTHAPALASMEHTRIAGRTPERTGTLVLSLTQEVNPDKDTLARLYFDPDAQLAGPWHRVYAKYQEGPPLGHTTYTNPPRWMVFNTLLDDLPLIRAWAVAAGSSAVSDIVNASMGESVTLEE